VVVLKLDFFWLACRCCGRVRRPWRRCECRIIAEGQAAAVLDDERRRQQLAATLGRRR